MRTMHRHPAAQHAVERIVPAHHIELARGVARPPCLWSRLFVNERFLGSLRLQTRLRVGKPPARLGLLNVDTVSSLVFAQRHGIEKRRLEAQRGAEQLACVTVLMLEDLVAE